MVFIVDMGEQVFHSQLLFNGVNKAVKQHVSDNTYIRICTVFLLLQHLLVAHYDTVQGPTTR